jgi:prepilin-type N-terminal cleavage/methylation domain-containing protein
MMTPPAASHRLTRAARRRLIGFTLVEVVVALAVILILAAVALPEVNGFLEQKKVEATAAQLAIVRDALFKPGAGSAAFRQNVGANAGRLSELSSAITNLDATYATGTDNSCGGLFSNAQKNNWPATGPFVNFAIDRVNGMATPMGQTADSLTRIPFSANPGQLRINFLNNVDLEDAQNLDILVDGVAGWNAGNVQWTPQFGTNGIVTMYYFVTIDNTC